MLGKKREKSQEYRFRSISRRTFVRMACIFSASLAIPRWIKSAVQTRVEALRSVVAKKKSQRQLNMVELSNELNEQYGMKAKVGTIRISPEKLPPRFQDERVYPGLKCKTPEGDELEFSNFDTLVFPDGYKIVDANGNGGLDKSDFNLSQGIEDILNKFKITPESIIRGIPGDRMDTYELRVQKISRELKVSSSHAEDQQYYPFESIALLFASAWLLAEEKPGMTRQEVSDRLETYISTLRFEGRQRAKLEELKFHADNDEAIETAAVNQAKLISSILDERENRVIPLLTELAEFVRYQ
jgi:hypothetical protein